MASAFKGQQRDGFWDVEVGELAKLGSGVRLIDVRSREEFDGELGHLERAELVPLGDLITSCRFWDRAAPVLLVCRSGNRSSQAARQLIQLGFDDVANLAGGMIAVREQEK